jgi:DNA polymerase-3 subunit epsilon
MLSGSFAFVDLETTGCNPVHDRITEVAILNVQDGSVTGRWSQLVDPGVSIPEAIQALTGISNAMVSGQPCFEDIAPEVHRRLEGAVFVAHNARFDHGFLRNALGRCGYTLKGPVLCTVKLSRRLYPAERSHGLDALIARHGLACSARHRALGDAEATWAFVAQAAAALPGAEFARHVAELTRRSALPARLGTDLIDRIPDAPGVYLFFDERDTPLYVGKSVHLRTRVLSHFAADHASAREMQLAQQTARIEWQRTAGELGALLKEAQLVKDLAPVYNRRLRRHAELVSIRWSGEVDARPELLDGSRVGEGDLRHLHGLFRSKAQARNALLGLADEHGLCLRLLGLEKGKGACFRYQVRKCAGACGGHEPLLKHQARLAAALARMKLVSWPWDGPVGIREADPDSGREDVHIVDRWCYIGTARDEQELLQGDLFARRPAFDMDTYKLLVRHLMRNRAARVVPLGTGTPSQAANALSRRRARV